MDASKTEVIEKLNRAQGSLARVRAQSKAVTQRVQRVAGIVAGGGLSGVLQVKMPFLPGTRIDSGSALGAAIALVAVSGWVDDESANEFLLGVGGGLLAAETCDFVRGQMLQAPIPRAGTQ